MYITSQRLVNPDGAQAINSYRYRHGPLDPVAWLNPMSVLDLEPGTLTRTRVALRPVPGNQVRSILEVVAPNETNNVDLFSVIGVLVSSEPTQFPWTVRHGPSAARLSIDLGLVTAWRHEAVLLAASGLTLG